MSRIGMCLGKHLAQRLYSTQSSRHMSDQGHPPLLGMHLDREVLPSMIAQKKVIKNMKRGNVKTAEKTLDTLRPLPGGPSSFTVLLEVMGIKTSLIHLFCKFRIS